jgi:hypothetical protein
MVAVQHVGIQINAIGPHDSARHRIGPHLREHGRIVERLENATRERTYKVELANTAIGEGESQPKVAEVTRRR